MSNDYKKGFLNGKKAFLELVKENKLFCISYPETTKDNEYSLGYYDGFVMYHQYCLNDIDVLNLHADEESEVTYAYKERFKSLKRD